jgi:putative chitinase
MKIMFDHAIYFDRVRPLFGGKLDQGQVDGQEAILTRWETEPPTDDLRHLAYALATTKHETASEMLPIEEYGKGEGQSYGKKDPETGQAYYGRGYVQLTWRENYARATIELALTGEDDLEWHADRALDPIIAAEVMFLGMTEGWFRTGDDGKPETLGKYFNETRDDPYGAREIVNGDKHIVPAWSHGVSIGNLIADYHAKFLEALLQASLLEPEAPEDEVTVTITIDAPANVIVNVVRT